MLGRPSNNLQIGIVGMPNVGKSSLFNIMSRCGTSSLFPCRVRLDEYGELTLCCAVSMHRPRQGRQLPLVRLARSLFRLDCSLTLPLAPIAPPSSPRRPVSRSLTVRSASLSSYPDGELTVASPPLAQSASTGSSTCTSPSRSCPPSSPVSTSPVSPRAPRPVPASATTSWPTCAPSTASSRSSVRPSPPRRSASVPLTTA